jgi:hypothetical protein
VLLFRRADAQWMFCLLLLSFPCMSSTKQSLQKSSPTGGLEALVLFGSGRRRASHLTDKTR